MEKVFLWIFWLIIFILYLLFPFIISDKIDFKQKLQF